MDKFVLYGTGGFGREVLQYIIADLGNDLGVRNQIFFTVDDSYYNVDLIDDFPVVPLSKLDFSNSKLIVCIGDSNLRMEAIKDLPQKTEFGRYVSKRSFVGNQIHIGEGSIITPGCVVTTNVKIGMHGHLNLNTTIGHDTIVGNFLTTGPGVNISGNNTIGDSVYLGTNACTREKISLGDNVTIGMGATVVKSVIETGIYVGNPAKKMD